MLRSVFQTGAWSRFKERFGWEVKQTGDFYGLERVLGFGKSMLYFPELPLNEESLGFVRHETKQTVPSNRIFTRFEFLNVWTAENAKRIVELGLTKAFEDVQPDYRQWILLDKALDIDPGDVQSFNADRIVEYKTEDELLKEMKPKGRYNIRVAEKHELRVAWGIEPEKVEALGRLYQETAKRTGFAGRDSAYFAALVEVVKKDGLGDIVTVSHRGEVLSAALVTFYGNVASYLYGGSGGDRSLMAPYLMHWAAIKRAKQEGCQVYDLLAIAPEGKENHVHAGLTRFKTQFGGQSVRMLGSWDLVHRPAWYTIYRYAQKRRRRAL